jgi:hypothetical protein
MIPAGVSYYLFFPIELFPRMAMISSRQSKAAMQ